MPLLPILFGKLGRVLFLLVGASFLLVVLTACAGGGGSGSGSSSSPGSDPGSGSTSEEDREGFTFAPIEDGVQISGQSLDLSDFVSLNITATNVNSGNVTHANISIAEFIAGGYNFTGLDDQSNYTFVIEGILLSDGSRQEVRIDFIWPENEEDLGAGGLGIRPGFNTDGDGRADSVDLDDDNDGLADNHTREMLTNETSGTLCSLLRDCDDDGIGDADEVASQCVVKSDCDDDDLLDTDERERLINSNDVSCTLLPDCDKDGIDDKYEEAECVIDPDCDGDNTLDGMDIDRDGDGLIELATAEELDRVRYALDGTGRRAMGEMLNTSGCVGGDGNNSCSGYELIADIELAAYITDTYGTNGWQPLGHDTKASPGNQCEGDKFDGTFEGNGRTIRGLDISRSNKNCVGLFGQLASGATIRNLTVIAEEVKGKDRVGILVGAGDSARIVSSSVEAAKVSGRDDVGGLVGKGNSAQINSSSIVANEVSGSRHNIGGLMGDGSSAQVHFSSVVAAKVSGLRDDSDNIGGLVGDGSSAEIHSSSVVANEVSGDDNVGGLVGNGNDAQVHSSSVELGNLSEDSQVGGLLGSGTDAGDSPEPGSGARIHSSSVEVGNLSGDSLVGGLVGNGRVAEIHSSSVVAAEVIGRLDDLGGLVGFGDIVRIINSSVLAGEVKGLNTVGGLVGSASGAQVYSSSVVVGNLSGNDDVGGLMGIGRGGAARIVGSFAVVASVNGSGERTGGLIGNAQTAPIIASFVVAGDIRGKDVVGGMLGTGSGASITGSFVVAEVVDGGNSGGLASLFADGRLSYSYLVVGNAPVMLVKDGTAGTGLDSYWDRSTSEQTRGRGNLGTSRSTVQLQMPTDYDEDYATWDEGVDIDFAPGIENITIWCDRDNSGDIEEAERDPANRIWDFGTENEYPVVRCSSLSPAEVRSWWFLDENDKPQLNQTRLDEKLDDLDEALELNQIRLDEALDTLPSLD